MDIRILRKRAIGPILPIGQPPPPSLLFRHKNPSHFTKPCQFISSLCKSSSIDLGPDTEDQIGEEPVDLWWDEYFGLEFPQFSMFRGFLHSFGVSSPLVIASMFLLILFWVDFLTSTRNPKHPPLSLFPRNFSRQDPYFYLLSAIHSGVTFAVFKSGYLHLSFSAFNSTTGCEDRRNMVLNAMGIDKPFYSKFMSMDDSVRSPRYISSPRKAFMFEKFNLALHIANPKSYGLGDIYFGRNVAWFMCSYHVIFTIFLTAALEALHQQPLDDPFFGMYTFTTVMFTFPTLLCYQHFGWYMKLGELAREIRRDCLMGKSISTYPPEKDKLQTWVRSYHEARKRLEREIWEILRDDTDTEEEAAERRVTYVVPILSEFRL